jgi:lysine 6-dehydrogenase
MRIIVLGTGLVGGAMVRDLATDKDFEITAVDAEQANLNKLKNLTKVKRIKADLSDASTLAKLVLDSDLVIGALPGFMGFSVLKAIIECGKDVVDISFFPEDALKLDKLAKEKQVTAVVDCGVAPGCSNLILGYMSSVLDQIESFACYVGGLPRVRTWPYEYKAPFSPSDVLEEYTRPSRMVENGKVVTKPALSEVELLDFPEVGTLEAFNTDGLRSLLFTMKVPNMKEKTMRYPGHAEKMRMLRESGFFSQESIQVSGIKVRPLDLTSKLLFSKWKLDEGEEDFTVMRIIVEGRKDGKRKQHRFDLFDRYDQKTNITSMARTTGYTCTTVARLLAHKKICHIGICPPEFLGQNHEYYRLIVDGLKEKDIQFKEEVEELN